MVATENERPPPGIREEVRSGILTSIKHDVELRGGRTARLLLAAGVLGVTGALGVTLLISGHPFGHHPPWHVAVFSAVWAGLLVVSFAIAFLQVRTPSVPLARAVSVGILGLGLAGVCGAVCPDQHFLHWWSKTGIGAPLTHSGGPALSALCFGLVTTLFFGAIAAFLVLKDSRHPPVKPILAAGILLILLAPGLALQSVGAPLGVFAGWLAGTAAGAFTGVAAGIRARVLLSSAPRAG
ncbi:MAG: hypothetical protein ACE5FL_04385 [Myxococcota bacterium]